MFGHSNYRRLQNGKFYKLDNGSNLLGLFYVHDAHARKIFKNKYRFKIKWRIKTRIPLPPQLRVARCVLRIAHLRVARFVLARAKRMRVPTCVLCVACCALLRIASYVLRSARCVASLHKKQSENLRETVGWSGMVLLLYFSPFHSLFFFSFLSTSSTLLCYPISQGFIPLLFPFFFVLFIYSLPLFYFIFISSQGIL